MSNKVKFNKNDINLKMKEKFQYKNVLSIPSITKIVINRGLGEAVVNSSVVETTVKQIVQITGQKPVLRKSKKAISNFKIRKDQVIGVSVTLRRKKMEDFLIKFLNIVLPKIRDFRGLPFKAFDGMGNYNIGIKEDSIFPELKLDMDKIRGFNITFVTTAKSDDEAKYLLELMGFPFRKN